jgi:hypothetical protein
VTPLVVGSISLALKKALCPHNPWGHTLKEKVVTPGYSLLPQKGSAQFSQALLESVFL